jgi:hypothetical protein
MTEDTLLRAFIKKAAEETGPEYLRLYTLLQLYKKAGQKLDELLEAEPGRSGVILERCKKHLVMLRKIQDTGTGEGERRHYYAAAFSAAFFVAARTGCWNGLKPLVLAFRHADKLLLKNNLRPTSEHIEENIAAQIDRFLHYKWEDEKMKALRRDMACDLADYLKPRKQRNSAAPETRHGENPNSGARTGWDLACTEPSPLWRYAYVRALGDLGVDAGRKGRLIHNTLDKAADEDSSPEVKEWAGKTAEALRRIRGGWEEGEHKRRLLHAFWWMRRTHMLTLQSLFDEEEALRTRNTEYR